MHVQIVNFNLKDMTDAEFRSMANDVAPAFASVPGLIGKIWLADAGKNTYGGVLHLAGRGRRDDDRHQRQHRAGAADRSAPRGVWTERVANPLLPNVSERRVPG